VVRRRAYIMRDGIFYGVDRIQTEYVTEPFPMCSFVWIAVLAEEEYYLSMRLLLRFDDVKETWR
jgi:membrane-associated protease RseP (regulator of RpoE activity)